jgi:hypothetical protein
MPLTIFCAALPADKKRIDQEKHRYSPYLTWLKKSNQNGELIATRQE